MFSPCSIPNVLIQDIITTSCESDNYREAFLSNIDPFSVGEPCNEEIPVKNQYLKN